MADDYKLQISSSINGDLVNIRALKGEELRDTMLGFAEHAPEIFGTLGDIKAAALAHGVFSAPASPVGAGAASPPKATAAQTPPGVQPNCDRCNGPTKDLRGKRDKNGNPYKNRYYCAKFSCKGNGWGEWVE